MSRHWIFLTFLGFLLAGLLFTSLYWVYGRILVPGSPKSQRIRRLPFWRRFSSKKNDDSASYELLRHYDEDRLEA